jgi:transcriptional regulator with XRE-family HTH domain
MSGSEDRSVNGERGVRRRNGELLRTIRQARGLTRLGCARLAGLGDSTIAHLEAGSRHVDRQTLERLGEALGMPDAILDLLLVTNGYLPTPGTWARLVEADRRLHERV